MEKNKKEVETIKLIGKFYYDFPLETIILEPGAKTVNGHRVSGYSLFKHTPENIILGNEHNKKLQEIEKLTRECLDITHKMEKYNPQ